MFVPKKIIFLPGSMSYEIGKKVYEYFKNNDHVDIIMENTNNIRSHFKQDDFSEFYHEGKRTLVLGVKKVGPFQTCQPSADYQLPLVSGCMGQCEYCYLQTQLKNNPFVKVNVNLDDILDKAMEYAKEKPDEITVFEGAATSDILPIEPYTGILSKTITFFGSVENARFRVVSKFSDVDTLLDIRHNDHTEIRFTINTDTIIRQYEHVTPSAGKRLEAAKKVLNAGYRVGFLIAPVFIYDHYQDDYLELLKSLKNEIGEYESKLTFEIISHRFTPRAKEAILEVYPESKLDMDESKRSYRMGQFGYGKYMYQTSELKAMKEFFKAAITEILPTSEILYII
jgi:spore photoproduct lyase